MRHQRAAVEKTLLDVALPLQLKYVRSSKLRLKRMEHCSDGIMTVTCVVMISARAYLLCGEVP